LAPGTAGAESGHRIWLIWKRLGFSKSAPDRSPPTDRVPHVPEGPNPAPHRGLVASGARFRGGAPATPRGCIRHTSQPATAAPRRAKSAARFGTRYKDKAGGRRSQKLSYPSARLPARGSRGRTQRNATAEHRTAKQTRGGAPATAKESPARARAAHRPRPAAAAASPLLPTGQTTHCGLRCGLRRDRWRARE
jgi:hypothetical protein